MPRLGSIKPKELIRRLKRRGFMLDHQTGSHAVLLHSDGARLIVPYHARELKRGLLMSLIKQAGLTPEEFSGL